MAKIGSAGGSAKYFGAENYYTDAEATASSEWAGKGATLAGLSGAPTQESLRAILEGRMPDGSELPVGRNGKRAFGSDFTFSAPKSISILALVGGDKRLLDIHQNAVKEVMSWAEKNLAYARVQNPDGSMSRVKTDNLVLGLFHHDTNREQEPQAHTHVLIANATQTADGKWRALDNRVLWSANTLLSAMVNSVVRNDVLAAGYKYDITGKHGQFDLKGFSRDLIMAWSTRREQILAAIGGRNLTPEQRNVVVLTTREEKPEVVDREAMYAEWREKASSLGFDVDAKVGESIAIAGKEQPSWAKAVEKIESLGDRVRAITAHFAERLGMTKTDPLMPRHSLTATPADIASSQVVASAIRHLSEREAGFKVHQVYEQALNFDLPNVTMSRVEAGVQKLVERGVVVRGVGVNAEMITTAQAIQIEREIMQEAAAGRGMRVPLMTAEAAGEKLQAASLANDKIRLNPGQEAAGREILSGTDRMFAIQGVAGAGKTTVLKPVQAVLQEHGKSLLVLSTDHETVERFRADGLQGKTIASFLGTYARLVEPGADPAKVAAAKATLKDVTVIVDESSKTSSLNQLKLNKIMNGLEVHMPVMGDERQQGAVAAGKPFESMQRLGLETVTMPENLRAISPLAKRLVFHLYDQRPDRAMTALSPYIVMAPDSIAQTGADAWLALDNATREQTGVYTDGRVLKNDANTLIQAGLIKEGTVSAQGTVIEVLDPENSTMEESRFTSSYRKDQVVVVSRKLSHQKLNPGEYSVVDVDATSKVVTLKSAQTGKLKVFNPALLKQDPGQMPSLELHQRRKLAVHEGDRVRFGSNDEKRGIHNAQRGTVIAIDKGEITIELKAGVSLTLKPGDPLLRRLDLAYAMNVYKIQGRTDTNAIALLDSRNDKLATEKALLTIGTRIRESLVAVMDDANRYLGLVKEQPGHKISALEIIGELPGRTNTGAPAPGAGNAMKSPGTLHTVQGTTSTSATVRTGPASADGATTGAATPTNDSWDAKAAAAFDAMETKKAGATAEPNKTDLSSSPKTAEPTRPTPGPAKVNAEAPKDQAQSAPTPKPEIEKKIDDGGSRTRQIQFDL